MEETGTKTQIADPQVRIDEGERATIRLWKTMGAIQAVSQIATGLGAQTIHALEKVRDEKLYLAAGFSTFDDFLSNHPESPMSHDTFRRRVNLLETEGDITFDLLNSLRIPVSARKLLAGQIEVSGNEIQIGDEKCSLDDADGVVILINTLHSKAQEQARTIERGKKEFEREKKKRFDAEEKLSRKGAGVSSDATPQARALFTVVGAHQILAEEVGHLAADEAKEFATICFQRLGEAKRIVEEAFGFKAPRVDLHLDAEETDELIAAQD